MVKLKCECGGQWFKVPASEHGVATLNDNGVQVDFDREELEITGETTCTMCGKPVDTSECPDL